MCGDINIDGIKLNANFLPTINLSTRITEHTATIIDNIFMKLNNLTINDEIESGNIFSDISDHLPNFIVIKSDTNSSHKSDENKRTLIISTCHDISKKNERQGTDYTRDQN